MSVSKAVQSFFFLTRYWIPKEGTKDMLNDGTVVSLTGPATYALKTSSGRLIEKVSKVTYEVSRYFEVSFYGQ